MTRNEVCTILDDILIENDFWFSEISDCRDDNAETISNLNDIFRLEKPYDFTLLVAAIKLLSKDSEPLIEYFKEDNSNLDFIKSIDYPSRTDLMIVTIGFLDSPLFFSKCWNMVAMIENEIAVPENNSEEYVFNLPDLFEPQTVICDIFEEPATAATTNTTNLTYIVVEPLGELQIQGSEGDDPCITAILFLKPEYQNFKFELKVPLKIGDNEHVFVIRKDSEDAEYDVPALNPWFTDFSQGYKIKSFTWEPLK